MDIQYMAPAELIPYGKNAKKHPAEQVKLIANSIREFGFQQPIVVDNNNVVVIGHGRLLAENCFLSTKKEEHYALCL
jgi:ParB-like chromosome segregation protein Spo0J